MNNEVKETIEYCKRQYDLYGRLIDILDRILLMANRMEKKTSK